MGDFRQFVEQQDFVDFVLNEFNGVPSQQAGAPQAAGVQPTAHATTNQQKQKVWSAKKPEIMQMWKSFRGDVPIILTPMLDNDPNGGDKSSYGEDGIRITGSWYFISSVLARLKELMGFENPQTKLRLVLRGIDKERSRPDRQSFVFYCNLENRTHGKPGRPRKDQTPGIQKGT